jgi:hypothetical protein
MNPVVATLAKDIYLKYTGACKNAIHIDSDGKLSFCRGVDFKTWGYCVWEIKEKYPNLNSDSKSKKVARSLT